VSGTALLAAAQATLLLVGPGGQHRTIGQALAAAAPWDTLRIAPGVYHEHLVVRRPVVLLGERGATLDGDGRDVVLRIEAPAVVRGLLIRNSGSVQSLEHGGILAVNAPGLVVEDNRIEDVLFGVYVKQSDGVVIRRTVIVGKSIVTPLRGDGIHLWYSHGGILEDNRVFRTRDVVIWFSDGTTVRRNHVADGRYGLHYMYSDHNVFEQNTFIGNQVGAFIMYSADLTFRHNVFAGARGATGRGLGFKDADRIVAEGNTLVGNAVGISIDNSPQSVGVENLFRHNLIAYNDVAVALLPSVRANVFAENDFVDNVQPVSISGGGTALGNRWTRNHWSEYAGFDENGDGIGDSPFLFERLSDDLLARREELQVLNLSPALAVLNTLSRVFPLLAPQPLVVDSTPRVRPATRRAAQRGDAASPGAAAGLLTVAALAFGAVAGLRRPFRSPR
jgi:nitrous oxidase accessory protein